MAGVVVGQVIVVSVAHGVVTAVGGRLLPRAPRERGPPSWHLDLTGDLSRSARSPGATETPLARGRVLPACPGPARLHPFCPG